MAPSGSALPAPRAWSRRSRRPAWSPRTDHPDRRPAGPAGLPASGTGTALLREDRRRREAWLAQRLRELDVAEPRVRCCRGPPRSSTGWPDRERHVPLPADPQLPAVRDGQSGRLTGTWVQRVAQGWLVLDLSNGFGVAVGHHGAAVPPIPALRPLRRSTRRPAATSAPCCSGPSRRWASSLSRSPILDPHRRRPALARRRPAFRLGVVAVVAPPARQAFVAEMVGPGQLPNAVSLNSATFNSARLVLGRRRAAHLPPSG